jgi:hypothetical protein
MEEYADVKIHFAGISISNIIYPNLAEINPYVSLKSIVKAGTKTYSDSVDSTFNPSWTNWPEMTLPEITLYDLLNDGIAMKLKHKNFGLKNHTIGDLNLMFKSHFHHEDGVAFQVRDVFMNDKGEVTAQFAAMVTFHDLPLYSQMQSGVHTDTSITGTPLLPTAFVPEQYHEVQVSNVKSGLPYTGRVPHNTPAIQLPNYQVEPTKPIHTPQPVLNSGSQIGMNSQQQPPPPQQQSNVPIGWEVRVDPNSGKQYYVDHNSKTTHWSLPPLVPPQQQGPPPTKSHLGPPVQVQSPVIPPPPQQVVKKPTPVPVVNSTLPHGWEEKYDDKGRKYYVNHMEKRTQWEDPRATTVPPTISDMAMSQISMAKHYAQQVNPVQVPKYNYPPQPQVYSSPTPSVPKIPHGWEQRVDPKTGRPFYVDHTTKTTHWTLPTSTTPPQSSYPPANYGPPPSQNPPPRSLQIPHGWEQRIDPKTGRAFYVDHVTKTTHWNLPDTNP